MQLDNFAYRAAEWNPINGNEIRLLNGVPIPRENRIYSLVSSTVVNHPVLGRAFHIYIPYVIYYGYENGRHGEVYMDDGAYINIRAFALPYADYRGAFMDNPFLLDARQEPVEDEPPEGYMLETFTSFSDIARSGGGELIFSKGPDDVIELIENILRAERGKTLDLVICVDTTGSMRRYINTMREKLISMLNEELSYFPTFRIGMVLYKDYNYEYVTKSFPFTIDFKEFQDFLNAIRVGGGGDIPEAVYEALYEGANSFEWALESRIMLLIGDAPPHPAPRGEVTREMVDEVTHLKNIKVSAMVLPH